MKESNSDIFIGIKRQKQQETSSENFFLSKEQQFFQENSNFTEPTRRLNDYDFNLLKEDAYKDIESEVFKLEYKIAKIEDEIKNLTEQLELAKEIQDNNQENYLNIRLNSLKQEYISLLKMYNEKSLSAKITNNFSKIINKNTNTKASVVKNSLTNLTNKLIEKLPKNFKTVLELKKSLATLENINKSVDDLMTLNIPYGEQIDKYEQLSKYIIKANSIQSEISNNIKKR